MLITRKLYTAATALCLASTTGCIVAARSRPVGVEFVVREPPSDRVEVVPAAPGPDYIWIKGNWAWRRGDFEWVSGRWERPAAGFHEWVPAHWEHEDRGWYFVEGRWR